MDFTLIKQAGMTQAEFGALVPHSVDRATVNLWVNGKMKPNRYIKDGVEMVLSRIAQALQDKQLPLPASNALAMDERVKVFRQTLDLA